MMRRIAFAVGDTAGHVNPALAIADAYRARFPEVDVLFLSAVGDAASRLVPAAGYDLTSVPAMPLARTGSVGKLDAIARIGPCAIRARRALRRRGARLVVGSGGYASGAVLLAARSLGLPTAIIEPNVEVGLANHLLAHVADRAYVTWPETAYRFSRRRAAVTGTPVRRALVDLAQVGIIRTGSHTPLNLLVTTGSRGDDFLGDSVPPLLAALRDRGIRFDVLHQGGASTSRLRLMYERHSLAATVTAHIDDMARAYAWSTFVIARAGAGTIAELALAGLPSLLVPLADAASDHQAANARRVADAGAAVWVRESEWRLEKVAERLYGIFQDPSVRQAMAQAAFALARPDAADAIVDDCEKLMEGRW